MKVASISELKDNLSAHLERVRCGETVVITDRKSPIATLKRIAPGSLSDAGHRLVGTAIISPRQHPLDPTQLLAMPLAQSPSSLIAAVLEERSESR